MDNFAQILQRLPISSASTSSSHSGGATPFKGKVNFYIRIFEGKIDVDAIDRWLNLLEGFLGSWLFRQGEDYFFTPQSCPPSQGLVGNPLWEKGWDRTLSILDHTHLELFPRRHQGTILSCGELWGQVHIMDHAVTTKGSRCAWADESIPYPAYQFGYQRFRETSGGKISQLSA